MMEDEEFVSRNELNDGYHLLQYDPYSNYTHDKYES